MIPAPAEAERSISSAAGENKKTASDRTMRNYNKKEGVVLVELDQFKYTLNSYAKPMTELRDSL